MVWNRLRSTYWFLPALVTSGAVALAQVLLAVDRVYSDATTLLGWVYGGGADGARALLSAVAGATMTVVSVTFSVIVVALTVSSQHFGPRLLNSFMRDSASQLVLGTFTGTFAYCLMVLRTVQSDGAGYAAFVPHLAVTVAFALSLLSIATLIFYVHHIARSLQVSEITASVAHEFERTVDRLYPEPFGRGTEPPAREPPPIPPEALAVRAPGSGYVQQIDEEAVLSLARDCDTVIWLTSRPGDFVLEDRGTLAAAYPVPDDPNAFSRRLAGAFALAADRTSEQDAGFAVQQLVEVGLRALSPGVNEPFTAMTCVDRLTQGLARLAVRRIPSSVRTDGDVVRVIAQPRTFVELLRDAFEPIARHASGNVSIAERLLRALRSLAGIAARSEDRVAVAEIADMVWDAARANADERVGAMLDELRESVRAAATETVPGSHTSELAP